MRGLSPAAARGGHSSSWCAGLSLSRPLLLQSTGSRCAGSVVVAHGPSCSAACGIFPDQDSNPCPLHWQADSQPLRHQGSPPHSFCSEHLVYSNTGRAILESSAMPNEISLIVLLLSKNKFVLPMLGLWFFQWLWNVKMVSVTYKKNECSNCELFPVGIISLRVRIRTSANRRMHLLRVFPHSCLLYPIFSNRHW